MGFQLVIAEGKEAGREFVFDQTSILIGRTSDCDVILYESGVSRKHARIFAEGEGFFVEDMGSSNGTKVNGEIVKKQQLKDGDAIGLGPVVFNFAAVLLEEQEQEQHTDELPVGEGGGQHTRVVTASELKRSRNKGVAALPENVQRGDLEKRERAATTMLPAIKPRPSTGGGLKTQRKSDPGAARRGPSALEPVAQAPVRPSRAGRAAAEPGRQLSAAERARLRREAGAAGGLKIWWAEASPTQRKLALGGAIAAGALVLGLAIYGLLPGDTRRHKAEPTALTIEPVPDSFGLGEGVTFAHSDDKTFEFEVKTPVQALVILHYMCKDISTQEVSVSVNGLEVGWLPADTMVSNERSYELLVPAKVIKRNEKNTVTFDNVKNPPDSESWRIWNLWVEVAVLPEKDDQALIADANDRYKKAEQKYEQKDIGASNLWEAYRSYREVWLALESLPESARPQTYFVSRDKMREVRGALDIQCNKLLLEARSAFAQKQYDVARVTLDHVADFFPSKAHPCQYRAEQERAEFDL